MKTNDLTPTQIHPDGARVLVRRLPPEGERKLGSGIIIPGNAKDRSQTFIGEVVAAGTNEDGEALPYTPGEFVLYQKLSGVDFDLGGVKHEMLSREEILGRVTGIDPESVAAPKPLEAAPKGAKLLGRAS